ncbi:hypothetical protein [Planktothrix sp.]|uniref:hypothetical protein n=3 Tax=Planktothrix sp. TaxID=3088171 RepID=UPI0038D35FCB
MNSLQLELDNINQQLELLTYRKTQLDSIMSEYSDVINRVKSLVLSMEEAMVEPSNLLTEIEGIIFNIQPELTPIENLINEQSEQEQEEPTEEQEPTPEHFDFDLRLFPKKTPQPTPEPEPEAPKLNALGLPIQTSTPETEPESKPEHIKRYPNSIYWDNGSSVRVFIPKKRRYKGELENIVKDCIEQKLVEQFEINECGDDWIIGLSPVTDEMAVNQIIDNFYPKHTDGEPQPTPQPETSNPELVKLMALVPVATEPTPIQTPAPISQLNSRAYRRNNTLLIGFTNKRLMGQWEKWFKENWADRLHISDTESLDNFTYCLSVLWYEPMNWERLKALDYSQSPDNQELIKTDPFEFKKATETTTQIFRDGVLLGLAKNCDGRWESPQFKGESFDSIQDIADRMWELINQF